ncbi:MAG: NHL repeat-containing protein [bacterium]
MPCFKIKVQAAVPGKGIADLYLLYPDKRILIAYGIGCGYGKIDSTFCLAFKPESSVSVILEHKTFKLTPNKSWTRFGLKQDQLNGPSKITRKKRGQKNEFYIADSRNHRIVGFNTYGDMQYAFGGFGRTGALFNTPNCLAVNSRLEFIVSDSRNRRIVYLSPHGEFIREIKTWNNTDLGMPAGLCVDTYDRIWIFVPENDHLLLYNNTGQFLREIRFLGKGVGFLKGPIGGTVYNDSIYIIDQGNSRIAVLDKMGRLVNTFGKNILKKPDDIYVDENLIWVLDQGNLLMFDKEGGLAAQWRNISSPGSSLCSWGENRLLITDFVRGSVIPYQIECRTNEIRADYFY